MLMCAGTILFSNATVQNAVAADTGINAKVDALLAQMTLDEKIGQMLQVDSGAPVVTILLSGRPLILNSALADSSAFVAAWLPGTEGQGVADVLFGDAKFTGKTPRSWPASNEHIRAGDTAEKPLFPLGFGLND